MNIYSLRGQTNHEFLAFYDTMNNPLWEGRSEEMSARMGRITRIFRGKLVHAKPVLHEWDPDEWPRIILIKGTNPDGSAILPSDYPSFSGTLPAFSGNAVNLLRDVLKDSGEILPINCEDGTYFLYNVTRISHAFDLEKSKTNDRNTWIYKYAFSKDIIMEEDHEKKLFIFRLSNIIVLRPLVTDSFIQKVYACGLKGVDFEKVWSSEEER